jgi:hypothetical protein
MHIIKAALVKLVVPGLMPAALSAKTIGAVLPGSAIIAVTELLNSSSASPAADAIGQPAG